MTRSFRLTPREKAVADEKFRRKERVIAQADARIMAVLHAATNEVIESALRTGEFKEPDLSKLGPAMEAFYRDVITEGWHSARAEAHAMPRQKRLAALPKGSIEKIPLKNLVDLFRDRRAWPAVMKRSKYLEARLRAVYLRKLRTRFTKLVPELLRGELSPAEAHKKLMGAWSASRARVQLVFRTETTKYFAETQVAYFQDDPDILGFRFDSIRDQARTEICRSRHGLIYRVGSDALRRDTPPCHYNCRSHLIPVANSPGGRKLLSDPNLNPENPSVAARLAPLPSGWR